MSSAQFSLRRATVDDLPTLRALWDSMRFPVAELEKRLTEFQVAADASGAVVGAVGFEMHQRHGRIHSEAYSDFSAADIVRPMLWTRLQSLCSNHGVLRLWTQEQSPYWTKNGLKPPADDTEKQKLPPLWNALGNGWLTLKLKDEEAIASIDKELALFMESEKARSAAVLSQAQKLKTFATVVAIIAALLGLGTAVYMLIHRDAIRNAVSGNDPNAGEVPAVPAPAPEAVTPTPTNSLSN